VSKSDSLLPTDSFSLDQLIALNDELAAFVRVGIPLESGLAKLGAEWSGGGGRLAKFLSSELEQGKSLSSVMAENPGVFPPLYRMILEAGQRSGRLASAMESVAIAARRIADVRRHIVMASVYPLVVVLLACVLFRFFVVSPLQQIVPSMVENSAPFHALFSEVASWRETAPIWGNVVPGVILLLYLVWLYRSNRVSMIEPRVSSSVIGWLPWIGRMIRNYQLASLAEIEAMLIEHGVPLPAAFQLGAATSGIPAVSAAFSRMADRLSAGESPSDLGDELAKLPPLLRWVLAVGTARGDLAGSLRNAANVYNERASLAGEYARVYVPVLLTTVVGGGVAAVYITMVFGTWISMLRSLV
jgi:general secretion pathway protein F